MKSNFDNWQMNGRIGCFCNLHCGDPINGFFASICLNRWDPWEYKVSTSYIKPNVCCVYHLLCQKIQRKTLQLLHNKLFCPQLITKFLKKSWNKSQSSRRRRSSFNSRSNSTAAVVAADAAAASLKAKAAGAVTPEATTALTTEATVTAVTA